MESGSVPLSAAGLRAPVALAAWVLLVATSAFLVVMAVYLVVRVDLLSTAPLTDAQFKSLWAFLGVGLGAVATLIGALLTEQSNRRTHTLALEAARREERAAEQQCRDNAEAETRMTLDTRTKVLELITDGDQYAPRARVAGAVATMMELRGGPVASRVLGELWQLDAIGTPAAVWLLDRVLSDPAATEADQATASQALVSNAEKLFPKRGDAKQNHNAWPELIRDRWPTELPSRVRSDLIVLCVRCLLSREPQYWLGTGAILPAETLFRALEDEEMQDVASAILLKLMELDFLVFSDTSVSAQIHGMADSQDITPWFARLLQDFEPWAAELRAPDEQRPGVD